MRGVGGGGVQQQGKGCSKSKAQDYLAEVSNRTLPSSAEATLMNFMKIMY